ncbi:phosphoenolpyruvate mutase [Actinoplanes sp. NPDC023714]|uniref:phosphoenolpyruvate mutase n=1 Tax=Actinoplanes sp. NPDC023714 TaxID=3154322 RepID=UPI0033EF9322
MSGSSDVTTAAALATRATTRLRDSLMQPELTFLMEAHDGLSARIAAGEGFQALWASGLSISTALGVRDSNEASWTQMLDVVEYMAEATDAPIVVDGDSGHGNFNSARRFSRKAERVGAAGVCFEDKLFPKMNSFVGSDHDLVPAEDFCAKIAAAKDAQTDPDFLVIARTEALIAGLGQDEALERAEAYRKAGADAVFIHSRKKTFDEIGAFAREWAGRAPLVIAPTTYAATTTDEFQQAGISAVIWANHSMRAAFHAIRDTCRQILHGRSVNGLDRLATLPEVFGLLDYDELDRSERQYYGQPAN